MKNLVPVMALTFALTGCAAIRANETHWTEQLLAAAGFPAEPAATVEELEPRTFVREMQSGAARYVYADPDTCRCLYTGSERQYQTYRKLRVEKEIAEQQQANAVRWTYWDRWPWP
jgi:hypothetical protein